MKFSKLPKEKRNHLIMVIVITIGVLAGLGFGLIKMQYGDIEKIEAAKATAAIDHFKMETSIKSKDKAVAELEEVRKVLANVENGMATSSDPYSWIINTIRTFRADYPKVDMPQFGQLSAVEDMSLFPKFQYKQVTLTITGKAHYHDLGLFLSDFENKFPHIRLLDLDLHPNPEAVVGEKEKIAFSVEVVVLIKPTS